MSMFVPLAAQVDSHGDRHITRWRPVVQWLLAVPHLMVASLFTVLFTEQIPRALFDMITTTYRYEWRAISHALFMHEDYPPFDFQPAAADDGAEPHTTVNISYPNTLTAGSRSTSGSWPSPTTSCWPSLPSAPYSPSWPGWWLYS
jgi:Domain of unknown function (DUF4389)